MAKFKIPLIENYWTSLTKLGTQYSKVKGIQVWSNESPSPFPKEGNNDIAKTH